MTRLRTVKEVVAALGGPEKLCEICGANEKQAWHWYGRANRFPADTYVAITRALKRRGHEADVSLWPMKGVNAA